MNSTTTPQFSFQASLDLRADWVAAGKPDDHPYLDELRASKARRDAIWGDPLAGWAK